MLYIINEIYYYDIIKKKLNFNIHLRIKYHLVLSQENKSRKLEISNYLQSHLE